MSKKVEVQEALPPAGVIGAEPLTLVPQHFPRKPAKRCLRATAANSGFFDSLWRSLRGGSADETKMRMITLANPECSAYSKISRYRS